MRQKHFIDSHKAATGIVILLLMARDNMRRKDRSLARYPEFAAYRARTRLFIPFLF